MGKIIIIANQKGGVGKTTTAINLSAALAQHRMKVLAIDCDPQGNCTSGLGIDKRKVKNSTYQMIIGECDIKDCIQDSVIDTLKVVPSSVELAGADIELIGLPDKEHILQEKIKEVTDETRRPTIGPAIRIAKALNTTVEELFSDVADMDD